MARCARAEGNVSKVARYENGVAAFGMVEAANLRWCGGIADFVDKHTCSATDEKVAVGGENSLDSPADIYVGKRSDIIGICYIEDVEIGVINSVEVVIEDSGEL